MPAASTARTSKVCEPSASGPTVCGDEQAAQAPASTRHSNVEPGSPDSNEKVGVESPVGSSGSSVIEVSGATVSTVNVTLAGV